MERGKEFLAECSFLKTAIVINVITNSYIW